MGITAKIWAESEVEVAAMLADPRRVSARFHAIARTEHALIHGARRSGLAALLATEAARGAGLRAIPGADDATYVLTADAVRSLAESRATSSLARLLTDFPTEAANRIELAAIIRAAATRGHAVVLCVFEDY